MLIIFLNDEVAILALLCNNNKSLTRIKYTVAAREDSRGQDLMRFTTNMMFLYTSCFLHFMSYTPFCCNDTVYQI